MRPDASTGQSGAGRSTTCRSRCVTELICAGFTMTDGGHLVAAKSGVVPGHAIYRASHDYQRAVLPSGKPAGAPQEALDCTCGLYLGDIAV